MGYSRTGGREPFAVLERDRRIRLMNLVLAECCEGTCRFLDAIIDVIWAICEESSWVLPAHNRGKGVLGRDIDPLPDVTRPDVDLRVAETGGLLATVRYLLRQPLDALTPLITERVEHEVQHRFLTPYLERNDFRWMGADGVRPNNWCVWITSGYLSALLLTEESPVARRRGVERALPVLDWFLDDYPRDGFCPEGSHYWGWSVGCLFDCLELLLSATDGKLSVYDDRLIQQLGRFMDKIHVSGPHFLNFADADAHVSNLSPHLLRTYGERIQSPEMISLAETVAALPSPAHPPPGEDHASLIRLLPTLFPHRSFPVPTTQLLARDVWLPEGQIMVARVRENDPTGFTLAMNGGHNGESHGHLDVGSIAVYHDGEPVVIDVGRELYRRKTSLARYELWYAQSAYHNVPTTNETEQAVGSQACAQQVLLEVTDARSEVSMELAGAYPSSAGIQSWRRVATLDREAGPDGAVEVRDDFSLTESSHLVEVVWMTNRQPLPWAHGLTLDGPTPIQLEVVDGEVDVEIERIVIDDARLLPQWGDHVYRIRLVSTSPLSAGTWRYRFSCPPSPGSKRTP